MDIIEQRIRNLPNIKTDEDYKTFSNRLRDFITFLDNEVPSFSLKELIKIYSNHNKYCKIYEWLEVDDFMFVLSVTED